MSSTQSEYLQKGKPRQKTRKKAARGKNERLAKVDRSTNATASQTESYERLRLADRIMARAAANMP